MQRHRGFFRRNNIPSLRLDDAVGNSRRFGGSDALAGASSEKASLEKDAVRYPVSTLVGVQLETMHLFMTVALVFVLLYGNELWWRKRGAHSEAGRKFIHITVGSFVAFWPFYLSWHQIQFLSVAFLVTVAISKYFHLFRAIHSVQRPTWGEIYFAIAVGAVTLITQNKWIYMAALLQMSLADGLAAIIGVRYGMKRHYLILGQVKSLIGTATFMLVSIIILLSFSHLMGADLSLSVILGLAYLSALIENIGVFGLDNLLVPILVATVLQKIT